MKGQRIGYVRVSTFDQNVDRQLDGQSLDRIFTDKASGKDINRPELDAMLAFAREGDTVVVHSMDRLARNLDDLRKLVQSLTKRGVRIEFVKESLAFSGEDSPMANLMLSVMGAFAEFERALIRERTKAGLASARGLDSRVRRFETSDVHRDNGPTQVLGLGRAVIGRVWCANGR